MPRCQPEEWTRHMVLFRFAILPVLVLCRVGVSGASGVLEHMRGAFDLRL